MLIIVEGCDRTGKSSLCERLRDDHGGVILHFDRPVTDDMLAEYLAPLANYSPRRGQNVFVDRHYLGETVWPQFFGRPTGMTDVLQATIEGVLGRLGACCVLAMRDPRELNEACRDEPPGDRAWLVQLDFESRAASSLLPWIEYRHDHPGDYEHVVLNAQYAEDQV